MKKILYLCKYELKRLKKTVVLTAVILMIFLAAMFGVSSMNADLMRNLCNHLDGLQSSFTLTAYDAAFKDIKDYDDRLIYGYDNFFGRCDIVAEDGKVFEMLQKIDDGNGKLSYYSLQGVAVLPNSALAQTLHEHDAVLSGRWVQNPYEIALSRYVASRLEVEIGESVVIGERSFEIVGIFDWPDNDNIMHGLSGAHVYTVDEDSPLERVQIVFQNSKEMFSAFRNLKNEGLDMGSEFWYLYDNITQMQAVFTAVTALLAIVIIITLYSLVSVLFKQRKTHICRLKILGATESTVMAIYCGIVIALLIVVSVLSTMLGIAFNLYFMSFCEQVLSFTFTANFNYLIPAISFIVLVFTVLLIWLFVKRKTKAQELAKEIRYE